MARPRPSPPCARVLDPSACRNRSNTWGRKARGIPGPVSSMTISAWVSARRRRSSTRPPRGVNLMALASRFQTTCCRRSGSAETGMAAGSSDERRLRPLASAEGLTVSRAAVMAEGWVLRSKDWTWATSFQMSGGSRTSRKLNIGVPSRPVARTR